MPTVRQMLDELLEREGGYNDIKEDRGGATNFGISLKYAKGVGDEDGDGFSEMDVDRDGDVDKDDIRKLSREVAEARYIQDFLREPHFDDLPEALVPIIFDIGVNSGPSVATRLLQQTINKAGFGPIACDGKVGPTTIRKAIAAYQKMGPFLVNALVDERINFYRWLVQKDPSQKKFIKGWLRRANEFREKV